MATEPVDDPSEGTDPNEPAEEVAGVGAAEVDEESPESEAAAEAKAVADAAAAEEARLAAKKPRDATGKFAPTKKPTETRHGHFVTAAEQAFTDLKVEELPDYVDTLNASHFTDLPTVAKAIVQDALVTIRKTKADADAAIAAVKGEVATERRTFLDREAALSHREAELNRKIIEFASLADNPEIKALLARPESELPDPMTEAGMQARIERAAAQGLQRVLEPAAKQVEAARANEEKARKQAAYALFVKAHPEMDPTSTDSGHRAFQTDVKTLLTERASAQRPITTEDAYAIVSGRRAAAAEATRAAREVRLRQEAATHMGRGGVSSAPGNEPVPADIRKRGAAAVLAFLEANPAAHRAAQQLHH